MRDETAWSLRMLGTGIGVWWVVYGVTCVAGCLRVVLGWSGWIVVGCVCLWMRGVLFLVVVGGWEWGFGGLRMRWHTECGVPGSSQPSRAHHDGVQRAGSSRMV